MSHCSQTGGTLGGFQGSFLVLHFLPLAALVTHPTHSDDVVKGKSILHKHAEFG